MRGGARIAASSFLLLAVACRPHDRMSKEVLDIVGREVVAEGGLAGPCGALRDGVVKACERDGDDVKVTGRLTFERCHATVHVRVHEGSRELDTANVSPPQGSATGPRTTDPGDDRAPEEAVITAIVAHPACCAPPFNCGGRSVEAWERRARKPPSRLNIAGRLVGEAEEAIDALECIGPDAAPALGRLLSADFPGERSYTAVARGRAAEALRALGPGAAPALPALLARLDVEQDTGVRAAVIFTLAALGEAGRPAVPKLIAVAGQDDENGKMALLALSVIDPEAARAAGLEVPVPKKQPRRVWSPRTEPRAAMMGRSLRIAGSVTVAGTTMPVEGALAKWTPELEVLEIFLLPFESTPEMLEGYRGVSDLNRILNKMATRDATGWKLVPTVEVIMALRKKSGELPPLVGYRVNNVGGSNVSSDTKRISTFEVSRIPPVQGRDVEIRLVAASEHEGPSFSCDLDLAFQLEGTPPEDAAPAASGPDTASDAGPP